MTQELCRRLRERVVKSGLLLSDPPKLSTNSELFIEAADMIERLEAQIARLEDANELAVDRALAAEARAEEAAALEREACARLVDPPLMHRKGKVGLWRQRRADIAAAIRARPAPEPK